jgi:hypothetical protein
MECAKRRAANGDPLRKRRDNAGRPKGLAPKGLREKCPFAALRSLASYVRYNPRCAPGIRAFFVQTWFMENSEIGSRESGSIHSYHLCGSVQTPVAIIATLSFGFRLGTLAMTVEVINSFILESQP